MLVRGLSKPTDTGASATSDADKVTTEQVQTADGADDSPLASTVAERPASRFMELVAAGEVSSIRLVGDSITAGFGTDGYADPDLAQASAVVYDDGMGTVHYETTFEARSWANAFRVWAGEHDVPSFVNAGINGSFMAELAENPDAWLGEGADVVFVALGTNDAGYYGPQEYAEAATTALAAASEKSKLVVVLSPVRDLRPAETLVEPAADLGDALQQICERDGYEFVDTRDAVTPEMFGADGLHPTSEGSLAIWTCIQRTLGM